MNIIWRFCFSNSHFSVNGEDEKRDHEHLNAHTYGDMKVNINELFLKLVLSL